MRDFFVNIDELPERLSKEETEQLFIKLANGDKSAKDELVAHNIRLLIYIVLKTYGHTSHDKKELMSAGSIGLMNAVDSYDITKGNSFTTYAVRCILSQIALYFKRNRKHMDNYSLDKIIYTYNGSDFTLEDTLADDIDIVDDFERVELYAKVRELVKTLPKRDQQMVMLRFGFYDDKPLTLDQIAAQFNVSKSFVSAVIIRSLKKINKQLIKTHAIEGTQIEGKVTGRFRVFKKSN